MSNFSGGVKKTLSAACVIVGTVIGAGYISGREIVEFFLTGNLIVSVILSACLFMPALYFLLTNELFKGGALKKVSVYFIFVGNLVMLGGMLSAADEAASSVFVFLKKIPIVSVLTLIFCSFTVNKGIRGIEKVNNFLVPFTVVFTLVLLFFASGFTYIPTGKLKPLKIISYTGLNLFMSSSVFKKTGETLTKRQAFIVSFLSTAILFGLVTLIGFSLGGDGKLKVSAVPLLEKLSFNGFSRYSFSLVLYFGIVTTLLSENLAVFNFADLTIKSEKPRKIAKILICVAAFSLSKIGFYKIVEVLYPAVGVIGAIFVLIAVIFRLLSPKARPRDTLKPQARKV